MTISLPEHRTPFSPPATKGVLALSGVPVRCRGRRDEPTGRGRHTEPHDSGTPEALRRSSTSWPTPSSTGSPPPRTTPSRCCGPTTTSCSTWSRPPAACAASTSAATVKVNYLVNLKSGLCPENCNYCSQALGSTADILKYKWLSTDEALEQAAAGLQGGASRVCMVSSGRGPTNKDVERVAEMVGTIKSEHPEVEICACLGLLKDGQAERLREAGVDAYNHNINTAESHHDQIVQTHTYADRVDTVEKVKSAGLSPCSGLIAGLGETDEQLVEALFALRELDSDSIPVNFLMPFDGTPSRTPGSSPRCAA